MKVVAPGEVDAVMAGGAGGGAPTIVCLGEVVAGERGVGLAV